MADTPRDKYRSFLHGEGEKNTKWRFGAPPNYDVVDKFFHEGRTKVWPAGSLEEQVQNLLKTWEMEIMHKLDPQDFKSMDVDKYTFSLNGRKPLKYDETKKLKGSYNAFLQTTLPEELRIYNPDDETVETGHLAFTTAFPRGFAIEILKVFSGPPEITFKFRHWAYMEGPFKGYPPHGELIEFFGIAIFGVDEKMRITSAEFFFDRGELLAQLIKGGSADKEVASASLGCPIMRNTG